MSVYSNGSSIRDQKFYKIRRNPESRELEFDPPKGTERLKDALHYHFPHENDYTSRVQRAIFEFCNAEGSPLLDFSSANNETGASPMILAQNLMRQSSSLSSQTSLAYRSNSGSRNRSRRKFNATERSEIYKNTNNICEKHRK